VYVQEAITPVAFERSLAQGDPAECYIRRYCERGGWIVKGVKEVYPYNRARWNRFDLLIQREENGKTREFTLEVKNDLKSLESGRAAFEYSQGKDGKKPSGILATKSDFWVHFIYPSGKPIFLNIDTASLKLWILTLFIDGNVRIKKDIGDNYNDVILVEIKDLMRKSSEWVKEAKCTIHKVPKEDGPYLLPETII